MGDTFGMVRVKPVLDGLVGLAIEPPAWTRLEPQSVSGDPKPGLEARIHDPLWLLARQWQFGEFRGEDAGMPLGVTIDVDTERATAWQPGDPLRQAAARALTAGELLDPVVEGEPVGQRGPSLRQRAEAGGVLVQMLAEAGFDARAALVAACPLPAEAPRLIQVLARSTPDAAAAAEQLEGGAPAWLTGAPAPALDAAQAWLAWYRRNVSPPPTPDDTDCWVDERLEYRFSVRVGAGEGQRVLTAPIHDGGAIDWYSFDHLPDAELTVDGEVPFAAPATRRVTAMATPVRFAGMPADRLWQFEDFAVNLGQLESQRHDLARLCFVEFAMIYGNDWFVVPLQAEAGCLTTVTELAYTDTFGDRYTVPPADDANRSGRFRLFTLKSAGGTMRGCWIPPATRGTIEGRALEEVIFLRDETANVVWSVEAVVEDSVGDPHPRRDEEREPPPRLALHPEAELRYLLATSVPRNWIPFVPVAFGGQGGFRLRKGTLTGDDESRGRLLEGRPYDVIDEEVPREGVQVRRVPAVVRRADGRIVRWIARRVGVGRGEGSSGLAFDAALRE